MNKGSASERSRSSCHGAADCANSCSLHWHTFTRRPPELRAHLTYRVFGLVFVRSAPCDRSQMPHRLRRARRARRLILTMPHGCKALRGEPTDWQLRHTAPRTPHAGVPEFGTLTSACRLRDEIDQVLNITVLDSQ